MNSLPFYIGSASINDVFNALKVNTRVPGLLTQDAPTSKWLFGTEPGDTKLAALQRFLEPLNCVAWMNPDGNMVIGRPDMAQDPLGDLVLDRAKRRSNVIGMKASFSAATVPNVYLPIYVGQEQVQQRVAKEQVFKVPFERPARLLNLGHFVQKTVVVSVPQGQDVGPSDASTVNAIRAAKGKLLYSYAAREAARQGVREQTVQVLMAGHYNELGNPFKVDTCYNVYFDRGGIFGEKMYLYDVKYSLRPDQGQQTSLVFCRLNTIVSEARIR